MKHKPKRGTASMGGVIAECAGCGQTIVWGKVDPDPAKWREPAQWLGGSPPTPDCPGDLTTTKGAR